MKLLRLRLSIIPLWVSDPLMLLGLLAPVITLVNRDWDALGTALVAAVVLGAYMKIQYTSRVVERTKDRVVVESVRQRRRAPGYRPLSRRTWILIMVGWVAIFVAFAFLPDDQAVGADFLLIIVTLIWIAYRMGRRRGASAIPPAEAPPTEATKPELN